MKTILLDILMIAITVALSAAFFLYLGSIIGGRQEQIKQKLIERDLTERERQDLTERRVMREWELQQQKEN